MKQVREPQVAGMFYPSDPKELRKQINGYLSVIAKTTVILKIDEENIQ